MPRAEQLSRWPSAVIGGTQALRARKRSTAVLGLSDWYDAGLPLEGTTVQSGDASLGHHLDSTMRTGTYCSYTPDPSAPPTWDG